MRRSWVVPALVWLLSACAPGVAPSLPVLPSALGTPAGATERVVLPSGEVCGYAQPGATFEFAGERLAWTCAVAPEGPRGLLGAPVVVGDAELVVRLVTTARRADGAGFAPTSETPIRARVTSFGTSDGATCAFVGEGATLSFAGRRVNYSCQREDVALGGFRADARGVSIEVGTLVREANGWVLTRARWVRVAQFTMAPLPLPHVSVTDALPPVITSSDAPAAPGAGLPGVATATDAGAATTTDAGTVSAPRLFGTLWRLVRASAPDGDWVVENPERYTLQLLADGQALAQFDCNRGVAQFDLRAEALAFAPWATTRVACAEGSRGEELAQALGDVRAYRLEGAALLLLASAPGVSWRFEVGAP